MKIDVHFKNLRESLEVIEECVQKKLLAERQRNIGFNTSAAMVDMLEILLHKKNLIEPGAQIKHEWFASDNKIKEKLVFDFPNKAKIVSLMRSIESKRNMLCYGKPQPEKIIEEVLSEFQELKRVFEELGVLDVE